MNAAVQKILDCMLNQNGKRCKECDDNSVCSILREAIFTCKHKQKIF